MGDYYNDQALSQWLHALLHQSTPSAPVETDAMSAEHGDHAWPVGPGAVSPQQLSVVIEQCLTRAPFVVAQTRQCGVTCGRLSQLAGMTKLGARALMVWFDAAQVLEEPTIPDQRWRDPRPFVTDDRTELAHQLRHTPLPTEAAVSQAFATATLTGESN